MSYQARNLAMLIGAQWCIWLWTQATQLFYRTRQEELESQGRQAEQEEPESQGHQAEPPQRRTFEHGEATFLLEFGHCVQLCQNNVSRCL